MIHLKQGAVGQSVYCEFFKISPETGWKREPYLGEALAWIIRGKDRWAPARNKPVGDQNGFFRLELTREEATGTFAVVMLSTDKTFSLAMVKFHCFDIDAGAKRLLERQEMTDPGEAIIAGPFISVGLPDLPPSFDEAWESVIGKMEVCDESEPDELVHYAERPFIALCGADLANQATTTIPSHVTCGACLSKRSWPSGIVGSVVKRVPLAEQEMTDPGEAVVCCDWPTGFPSLDRPDQPKKVKGNIWVEREDKTRVLCRCEMVDIGGGLYHYNLLEPVPNCGSSFVVDLPTFTPDAADHKPESWRDRPPLL